MLRCGRNTEIKENTSYFSGDTDEIIEERSGEQIDERIKERIDGRIDESIKEMIVERVD